VKSFLALILTFFAGNLAINAGVGPLQVTVDQVSKTEAKGKTQHDKTQTRLLKIRITNNSGEVFDGLTVKYWFVGHGETEHHLKALKDGSMTASIAAHGEQVVESETVKSHYVEQHSEVSGRRAKNVAASGEKIVGYAVRVMKDGNVLGETYSDSSYKDLIK
jgi:hypothetical protein